MSRVDLATLGERLRDFGMDECAASLSLSETLAIADLIEKARELLDYQKLGAPDFADWDRYYDAIAALFDGEDGR